MTWRNSGARLALLLIAVFVLKLVVVFQLKDHPLTAWDAGLDTTAYVQLADKVLAGDWGLGPGLYYVSPFYIYFLAALLALGHSFVFVRLVQIALGTAAVGLVFLTARHWFGERAAWIAAGLAALTGIFTFYEVLILQSSVDVFLTAAALYLLTRGSDRSRHDRLPPEGGSYLTIRFLLLAGIIWGLQALNRPNVLIAVFGVAIVVWIVTRRAKPAAVLIAGLLIGMGPVAIRNVVVSGELTLVSSHGGLNLYIGNGENATGFYRNIPGLRPTIVGQEVDTRRIAERALGRAASDAEVSRYFTDLALAWMKAHPIDAAGLFLKKCAFAFHAAHVPLPHSYPFYAYDVPTALRFMPVGAWLLTPLGLAGLLLVAPRDRTGSYLIYVSFVPAYAASVALFFVAERYRLPLMVPLCVGAGAAVAFVIDGVKARQWMRVATVAVAAGLLAVAANARAALNDGRWTEGLRLAQRLAILERYDEADRWMAWLDRHDPPRPWAGPYEYGLQLLTLGKVDRALPYLQRAHQTDPSEARVDYALGMALLKNGRPREALEHLRHGFEGGVDLPDAGVDYVTALRDTGDLQAAAAALARIRPAQGADAEAWLRLGRLGMDIKAPQAAEPFFRQAAQLQPQLAAARQQYGLNLLVLREFDGAARELGEAVRLNPSDGDALSRLAYVELQLGRRDDARRHVMAALAVNPGDPLARQLADLLR